MALLDFLNKQGKKVLPVVIPAVSFFSPLTADTAHTIQNRAIAQSISIDNPSASLEYFQNRCEGSEEEKHILKSLLTDLYQYPEGKDIISKMDKRTTFGVGQPNGGGSGLDPETLRIGLTFSKLKDAKDKNSTEYKEALTTLYHEAIHAKQHSMGQFPHIKDGVTGTEYARNYKMLEVETFAKELSFADKVYGEKLPANMDGWKKAELETFRTYKNEFQKKNPQASAKDIRSQIEAKMVDDLWTAPQRLDMKTPIFKQKNLYDESLVQWHEQRTNEALSIYEKQKKNYNGKLSKNKDFSRSQMQITAKDIGGNFSEEYWTKNLSLERIRQISAPTEEKLTLAREKFVSDMEKASKEKKKTKSDKLKRRAAQKYQSLKTDYDNAEWIRQRPANFFKNEDKQTTPTPEATKSPATESPSQSQSKGNQAVSTAAISSLSSQR